MKIQLANLIIAALAGRSVGDLVGSWPMSWGIAFLVAMAIFGYLNWRANNEH